MTAKEYLGQAYRLDQRINSKLQQVESLRSLTQKVTASYSGEPVLRTRNVTSLQDTILRLMEAEDLDAALLMLSGPAGRAITGTVITIDDGQSLPGGG